MYRKSQLAWFTACLAVSVCASLGFAREIHVAESGDDANAGTASRPVATISKAAENARPGDVVIVHAGTYREWVRPPRGGTGQNARITYRAAPGEQVLIKGSEQVATWSDAGDGVWKVELPNTFFGDYNPYALTLSGGWLLYGQWHHRGDVYLDGKALGERQTRGEVAQEKLTWCCQTAGDRTTIWANFGSARPNAQLAEINVRPSIFFPEKSGLRYITVDGLHLLHSAENWEPPGLPLQMGAIGPRMGKHWIIQNCTVTHARCVGIILGHAQGVDYADIDAFGDHIVRNNVIRHCGEAGIAGQEGAARCVIENNLIEDTNDRREFGGWETAAIKLHQSVDTIIRHNLIRRVQHRSHGAFGIWLDWANQGARVTGNIICDTETEALFLEMDHGPTLVDNNILIGGGVKSNSEATVFAHNLFVDCPFSMVSDTGRKSQYHQPHSKIVVSRKSGIPQDDKWFYNIFVRQGLDRVKPASGYVADSNLFLEGAQPSRFGGKQSRVDSSAARFERHDHPEGISIQLVVSEAALEISGPRVDGTLVGVFPTVGQTIEDRDGKLICVDRDALGSYRKQVRVGPLADLQSGINHVFWSRTPTSTDRSDP